MDMKVVLTSIGHDLILWIGQTVQITIYMICTITMEQQLMTIYNLIILCWCCSTYWNNIKTNILGTIWVCLCQLEVSSIYIEARI